MMISSRLCSFGSIAKKIAEKAKQNGTWPNAQHNYSTTERHRCPHHHHQPHHQDPRHQHQRFHPHVPPLPPPPKTHASFCSRAEGLLINPALPSIPPREVTYDDVVEPPPAPAPAPTPPPLDLLPPVELGDSQQLSEVGDSDWDIVGAVSHPVLPRRVPIPWSWSLSLSMAPLSKASRASTPPPPPPPPCFEYTTRTRALQTFFCAFCEDLTRIPKQEATAQSGRRLRTYCCTTNNRACTEKDLTWRWDQFLTTVRVASPG